MPWKVYQRDGRWCVHKKNPDGSPGEVVPGGCHSSQAQAMAQMRALYASERPDDGRPDDGLKQTRFQQLVSSLKELFGLSEPETDEAPDLFLWKEQGGRLRWLARYSNNFRDDDRPREIISSESHQRFVERVDKGLAPMPELWIWHVPEWKFGQADWVAYDDAGFAMASGIVDTGKERVAEWVAQQKGVRMSHGMPVSTIRRDPDDLTIIVEHETREISVLPEWAAANKFTGFVLDTTVKEADVTIPMEKARQLIEKWGADPALLDELQALNASDAEKAAGEQRDSKERDADDAPETPTPDDGRPDDGRPDESEQPASQLAKETPEANHDHTPEIPALDAAVEPPEEKDQPEPVPVVPTDAAKETGEATVELIRAEVAEVVVPILQQLTSMKQQLLEVSEGLSALSKERQELPTPAPEQPAVSADEQPAGAEALKDAPAASIAALIAERMRAVGASETVVDGRSSLARSKPKEAPAGGEINGPTPVPFINRILGGSGE
jgi:hypothetical protein